MADRVIGIVIESGTDSVSRDKSITRREAWDAVWRVWGKEILWHSADAATPANSVVAGEDSHICEYIVTADTVLCPSQALSWAHFLCSRYNSRDITFFFDAPAVDVGAYMGIKGKNHGYTTDVLSLVRYPQAVACLQKMMAGGWHVIEPLPAPPQGCISATAEAGLLVCATVATLGSRQFGALVDWEGAMLLPVDFYKDREATKKWISLFSPESPLCRIGGVLLPAVDTVGVNSRLEEQLLYRLEAYRPEAMVEPFLCYIPPEDSKGYVSWPIGAEVTFRGISNTLIVTDRRNG